VKQDEPRYANLDVNLNWSKIYLQKIPETLLEKHGKFKIVKILFFSTHIRHV
jgi:hypothetical protein